MSVLEEITTELQNKSHRIRIQQGKRIFHQDARLDQINGSFTLQAKDLSARGAGSAKGKKNDGQENFISLMLFCLIAAPKWIRRVLLEEERVGRREFPI